MNGCLDAWRNGKIDYSFEEESNMIQVLEIKGIDKGKVDVISVQGKNVTVLAVPKKKTYKQYLKEISKLNF